MPIVSARTRRARSCMVPPSFRSPAGVDSAGARMSREFGATASAPAIASVHELIREEHGADSAVPGVRTHRRTDAVANQIDHVGRARAAGPPTSSAIGSAPTCPTPTRIGRPVASRSTYRAIASTALSTSCACPTTSIVPWSSASTGTDSPASMPSASRPPRRATSSAPTMKTFPTVPATARAAAAAASRSPLRSSAMPAAHTQHAIGNDAVPVSTISTGTDDMRAASVADCTVAEVFEPM